MNTEIEPLKTPPGLSRSDFEAQLDALEIETILLREKNIGSKKVYEQRVEEAEARRMEAEARKMEAEARKMATEAIEEDQVACDNLLGNTKFLVDTLMNPKTPGKHKPRMRGMIVDIKQAAKKSSAKEDDSPHFGV